MVKHIVMLKLKDYADKGQKLENALKLKKAIEDLKIYIDELKYMEVGLNFNERPSAYDLVLTTTFNSEDDLEKYREHPEHKKVLIFLRSVTDKTSVVDYEI
ncbi:MAG: Dabb family protein [Bacteroidetes bacterium]|nr:Dabb family protein [Bacteroidota bacterium]MBL7104888.1 Dabb family protein [Bacteroidales bacterium]